MRRDLVEDVLAAAQDELFEDVLYSPVGGSDVLIEKAIFGIEPSIESLQVLGRDMQGTTHTTRAIRVKFPGLAKGDLISDGTSYMVIGWRPVEGGDGRLEIEIGLKKT